jgi:DNA processing protein
LSELANHNTSVLIPSAKNYPKTLIEDKPIADVLYTKGNIGLLTNTIKVAIVGSRKPTTYGKQVARALSTFLAERGICVVSGMAMGIDGIVHHSALEAGGSTIAILATGVNLPSPACHTDLYREILKHSGLILSERGMFEPAKPFHFPYRNRLISGISDALVVIEAAEKSGSLTTVQHALQQGKAIYAVPGSIFSSNSKGTNQMIFDGATPLIDFELLLESLGIDRKNTAIDITRFSETAQSVYYLLKDQKCMEIHAITQALNREYSDIIRALGELALDGFCEFQSLTRVCFI